MSDAAGTVITRFDFTSGLLRGTYLMLYSNGLVHRGEAHLETLPLSMLASVRVSFERGARQLGWGASLVVIALLLLAVSGTLSQLAAGAAADLAGGTHNLVRALHAVFQVIEALAGFLPVLALVMALAGAALFAAGWMGTTTLSLAFAGAQRDFVVRGRNSRLLDFAEALSERLMHLKR